MECEQPIDRHELIAHAAFFIAEQHGFQGGDPVADWLLTGAMSGGVAHIT